MLSGVIPRSRGIPPDVSIKLDMTVLLVLSIFPRFVSLMSFVSSLPVGIIATLGFLKTFNLIYLVCVWQNSLLNNFNLF